MAAVFLKLLNLSISASWLVLAVLVLRLISKRSPKWVNVLLWGIVALRLVLPFSIESALSLIPSAETVSPAAVQFDPAPTITSGVSIIDNAVNPSLSEHFAAVPTASVNPLYVWTEIAGWVWLIGLGAMLLYALVSYLRLRRRVSVSLPVQDHIYLCDAISSPFILGVVKPHIYLPSGLDEVQRQNVLAHEQAHLARRDHWWKPLGFALLAVYWFNPVLWLAYTLLCRDIELACDERVIRTMDESAVKTYSTVLLACSMPRKAVITCPLAFGEVGVKERVKNALHYKKPAFWVVAASVAVCVVVAVCFLTNPPTDTDAAGLVGFHREQVTYADVTDASGAQPSSVQLTAEETDAVYALLDAMQYKRLGAASAMQDCYARLYFISAAGERCEVMLSEREMLVNPITGGKTARLYELRSGSMELRDYLLGCIGASDAALTASSVSIQKISETAYRNALAEEKTSTVWDGGNSFPVCPERGTADYYRISVRDAGYNNELPIDANIYFAVIPGEGLAEESYFTLMEMPASPRYQNVITYATDAVSADVFLKLEISVVAYYDGDGQPVRSEDFTYALSCFCDLETLEIQQLRTTGEGFRPENGSSAADALIGSYNAIEQHQDSIVLDAEKWQGNYSKTFIVTDKTKVPISTLITVYFTYESNDNGGYSIVSIDSVKAEKNSGWTYVDNVATVNGDILYSNQRSEAVIPITYQASIGSGLEPQDCLIRLDLSQIDRLTLPSQDEIDNLHGDTASDDFSISGTVFSYGDESWDLAEQSPAITSLLNCDAVGQYVVITGHGGPKNALYFIFDTESRSFSNAFIDTHLVWQYDDLSTAAYVDGSNILSIDGRTLAELDLAENEYVYGLSYSQDGTVLTATIVSSEETERIVRLTLP
ncbi:M56 family metallopeptidase [Dysosmobacter sp.]|uniref:M56 family metallopeptidase n=1 Tax=Dysosmobacter sp. TaxID=2591382 RepID=UPI003AB3A0AD